LATKILLPELIFLKTYAIGHAQQLLRSAGEVEITATEKIKVGHRSAEECWVLEGGERVVVTKKSKLDRPEGIDGVLRLLDSGKYKWLSHRLLDSVQQQVAKHGLRARSEAVAQSWPKVFRYKAQACDKNGKPIPESPGLRPPQLGALFAIGSHWSLHRHPATVVMPTGTGKTETMLSTLAALPQGAMLVAVPSKALRKQTARKFVTFGLLRTLGLLPDEIENPVVGILAKQPKKKDDLAIFDECNVVVSVIPSLSGGKAREFADGIAERCGVLIVDEAHHVGAPTWQEFREAFVEKRVLQFTATPFRTDGKLVDGQVIFSYALRRAQEDGYFKPIRFVPIHELSPQVADDALAQEACKCLRADLAAGYDHLVMARCATIDRAEAIQKLYWKYGKEFAPQIIHSELVDSDERVKRLLDGSSRIAVCVNMLGEGFDLPALKIATLHDPQKSLGPLLQFTGRFTRTSGQNLGDATVIANIADPDVSTSLERLYSEDSDWNVILSEMSSQAAKDHARLIEFLSSSIVLTEESDEAPKISHHLFKPALSTLTYFCAKFTPKNFHQAIPDGIEVVKVWLNEKTNTLYFVTRAREKVKWSRSKEVIQTTWDLFVLHYDAVRDLLYLASSDKSSSHEKLAESVGAKGQLSGEQIFRSLGRFGRLVFNNLGVTKHGRRNLSYAMYTGADVRQALSQSEKAGSRKANLSGVGWERGKQITIGCSYKGRVWSRDTGTIPEFIEWAENVGEKLLDVSINTADIIDSVLIPDEVSSLPDGEIMGIEWPVEILRQAEDRIDLKVALKNFPIYLCDIQIVSTDRVASTIHFRILNEQDETLGEYALKIGGEGGFSVTRLSAEPIIMTVGSREALLEEFFGDYPPLVRYFDLAELDGNLILRPQNPYDLKLPASCLHAWDWSKTDITKESIWKGGASRQDSIQWAAAQKMIAAGFDVVFDDDGPGEAADLVCMKEEADYIRLALVHCKFSGGGAAGARIKDVVEVASQGIRSAKWTGKFKELCRHLVNRSERRAVAGRSFTLLGSLAEIGQLAKASRLKEIRPEIVLVQPGVSIGGITNDQSIVLGAAATYLRETIGVDISIACSK